MKHNTIKYRYAGQGRATGFTLIELLVVVAIIVLLIAILVPTMKYTRDAARKATTQQTLAIIDTGMQGYYSDFNMYPPSVPSTIGSTALNRGGVMLAQGLVGYLDYQDDGAGPSNPANSTTTGTDPVYGFRVKAGGNGRIFGPYVPPTPKTWKVNDPLNTPPKDRVFIDGFGNEILYYRSTQAVAPSLRPTATLVFGSSSNALFVISDNPTGTITNADGSALANPSTATAAKFWSQVGTASNTLSTGVVLGRDSYLLVTSGPDGIYFNADDVLSGR